MRMEIPTRQDQQFITLSLAILMQVKYVSKTGSEFPPFFAMDVNFEIATVLHK